MSLKNQLLRDLVVERLVVAADEIFALFERTFAEYEEDLRTKLQQEPREELRQQKGLSPELGAQTAMIPPEVKYEDRETPLELPFSSDSFKSEQSLHNSFFYEQETAEGSAHDASEPLYGAEEPGCSMVSEMNEYEPYSCSETENSEDWEPAEKRNRKSNGQNLLDETHTDVVNIADQTPENRQFVWTESGASLRKQVNVQIPAFVNKLALIGTKDQQDKPFSCSVCKKTFPQKRNLKSHMRVHTGERPYHCIPCGLSFKFQQNYNQHDLSVHRKDKPFRCRVCKKDFGVKSEMIAHRNSHESSFRCSTCDKVFNSKKYLRRHVERCPRKKRPTRS